MKPALAVTRNVDIMLGNILYRLAGFKIGNAMNRITIVSSHVFGLLAILAVGTVHARGTTFVIFRTSDGLLMAADGLGIREEGAARTTYKICKLLQESNIFFGVSNVRQIKELNFWQ